VVAAASRANARRYIFAGLCASLVSIGLARFAFTPLIPELIQHHWFSATGVVYLGAANLAGYLFGAVVGRRVGARLGNVAALRAMMVLITLAFLGCAFPISMQWFFSWRLVSGFAGGVVMVLVAATVLPHMPPDRRGAAGGAIFLGLGMGIAGSGTLVPLMLDWGLMQTWVGLAAVAAVLTVASWFAWPPEPGRAGRARTEANPARVRFGSAVRIVYLQYALMAAAAVPTMVFLVDFISRGLGRGTHEGSIFWAVYGLGATAGPPVYGSLADRLGGRSAVRVICVVMLVTLTSLWASSNRVALGVETLVIGTFAPGMVPLMLARMHEVVHEATGQQNVAWTRASIIAAAGMALAAYAFSALFGFSGGSHRVLFLAGAGCVAAALFAGRFAGKGSSREAQVQSGEPSPSKEG
jgi:predicted MFS family arabinose efflux permease